MNNQDNKHLDHDLALDSLDKLINDITSKEYELKSAMLVEDDDTIEELDREISNLLNMILDYNCANGAEKKMLLVYLFDRYLIDKEISSLVPSGVMNKMRSLF